MNTWNLLQVPSTKDEWEEIAHFFNRRWNFPRVCGAIDGKHINIKKPPKSGAVHFNYKKQFSIVLFALVDAQYCFRYINVGAVGSAGDAGIFRTSTLYRALEQNHFNFPPDHVILGDEAFPLKEYLMKPYRRRNLTVKERIFNYRLSRARRVVENAFGILAWRFRVFLSTIDVKVVTVDKIVCAACVLHNWLRMTLSKAYTPPNSLDIEDFNSGECIPGLWRSEVAQLLSVSGGGNRNFSTSSERIRDQFAEYFMDDGSVPWQWNIIGEENIEDAEDELAI